MFVTRLSSKGQVIIPKAVRATHHWEVGLELVVIDTGDGILLKPRVSFPATRLADVAGMLKDRVQPQTDAQIAAALQQDLLERWRDRD